MSPKSNMPAVSACPRESRERIVCPFCRPPPQRVLARAGPFCILQPLDAILQGEILIIPRKHVASMTALPLHDKQQLDTIWHRLLMEQHTNFSGLAFEHGNHARDNTEPWHEHAHMHIIPAGIDIAETCVTRSVRIQAGGYFTAGSLKEEYTFVVTTTTAPTFHIHRSPLPRGFLRTQCALVYRSQGELVAQLALPREWVRNAQSVNRKARP